MTLLGTGWWGASPPFFGSEGSVLLKKLCRYSLNIDTNKMSNKNQIYQNFTQYLTKTLLLLFFKYIEIAQNVAKLAS